MAYYAVLYIFPAIMLFAAFSDLFTMKISNVVSLLLLATFPVMAYLTNMPLQTFGWSLACGFTVLLITFGMFAMGWIGGGDAKLAAATALWLGWALLMPYLLVASVFGGLLTLGLLIFRRIPLPPFAAAREWIQRLHEPRGGIPYGIALAASALFFYPSSSIWVAAVSQ